MRENLTLRKRLPVLNRASRIAQCAAAVCFVSLDLHAADVDPAQLPPPTNVIVDFDRDIQPILEASCLRCHGPARPKSGFRLDNRESALQGGHSNTDDIVPGDGASSRLIHYVARVVEDMEMPPEGKGDPLTAEQVGLLRAWIDQGANWGQLSVLTSRYSLTPLVRWTTVDGNDDKFRELEGIKAGWAGGLEEFSMAEPFGPDERFTVEARRIIDENDARVKLSYEKARLGFVRIGLEQWRQYYDDTGGYYRPFTEPSFDLNRDLELDEGRVTVDVGLALPAWPLLVLGYEYRYRDGAKSTLQWGTVSEGLEGDGSARERKIYPSAKEMDEEVHILKFDLTHEVGGWRIEDNVRVEFYDLHTSRDNTLAFASGPRPDLIERVRDHSTHVQGANVLRVEKSLADWWLISGGYLFSKFEGDNSLEVSTLDAAMQPAAGRFWNNYDVVLKRDAHVTSLANLFNPLDCLSLSANVQAEWTRQEGFGDVTIGEGDPNVPQAFFLEPARVDSNHDQSRVSENIGLRFSRIPRTILFGEARFDQESTGQYEEEIGDTHTAFLRDTDATNHRRDWRAGLSSSPWRWLSVSAHYRQRWSDSDYDHRLDQAFENGNPIPGAGYSAFIRARELDGEEVEARVVVRPVMWLKGTLTYHLVATDYRTATDELPFAASPGDWILAGNYDAHVYGANLTVTPRQWLHLGGTVTYADSRTVTADNHNPSVVAYRGDTVTVLAHATCALSAKTDLLLTYHFSRADYSQNQWDNGLPLGIDFTRHGVTAGLTRQWKESLSTTLRYGFYQYDEPSSGAVNDYTAHGIFLSMNYRWQ